MVLSVGYETLEIIIYSMLTLVFTIIVIILLVNMCLFAFPY